MDKHGLQLVSVYNGETRASCVCGDYDTGYLVDVSRVIGRLRRHLNNNGLNLSNREARLILGEVNA